MRETFCLASGPSMTAADAARVKAWRDAAPEREVIVVNTTYRLALWADVLYAMDRSWWNHHKADILRSFHGAKFSAARQDDALDVVEIGRAHV